MSLDEIELLKMDEVAEILKVSEQRAYDLVRKDILPGVKMGRQVRVSKKDLMEWIEGGGKTYE